MSGEKTEQQGEMKLQNLLSLNSKEEYLPTEQEMKIIEEELLKMKRDFKVSNIEELTEKLYHENLEKLKNKETEKLVGFPLDKKIIDNILQKINPNWKELILFVNPYALKDNNKSEALKTPRFSIGTTIEAQILRHLPSEIFLEKYNEGLISKLVIGVASVVMYKEEGEQYLILGKRKSGSAKGALQHLPGGTGIPTRTLYLPTEETIEILEKGGMNEKIRDWFIESYFQLDTSKEKIPYDAKEDITLEKITYKDMIEASMAWECFEELGIILPKEGNFIPVSLNLNPFSRAVDYAGHIGIKDESGLNKERILQRYELSPGGRKESSDLVFIPLGRLDEIIALPNYDKEKHKDGEGTIFYVTKVLLESVKTYLEKK